MSPDRSQPPVSPLQAELSALAESWLNTEFTPELLPSALHSVVAQLPAVCSGRLFVRTEWGADVLAVRRPAPGVAPEVRRTELCGAEAVWEVPERPRIVEDICATYRAQLGSARAQPLCPSLCPSPCPAPAARAPATLCLPLAARGVTYGALHLDGAAPDLRAALDLGRLHALTLAMTLQRLELGRALQASQRETALLDRAWQAVAGTRGQDELFAQITAAVHELLHIEHVGVGLLEDGRLRLRQFAGGGAWNGEVPVGEGVAGRVARSGEAALVADVRRDPDYVPMLPGVVSEICVPLLDGSRVVGVLNAESEARRLGAHDLRALAMLGTWLGRAIERERLYADTERQRLALDLLHNLRTAFGGSLNTGHSIRAVTRGLKGTFGYSHVSVYLLEGDMLVLQDQVGYAAVIERLPVGRGVMGRACRSRQVQWVPDLRSDPDAVLAVGGISSEVCVPLLRGPEVIGVLNVETVGDAPALTGWDAQLIRSVGTYLQQALERSWLHGQVRDREALYRLLAEHTHDLVCLHRPDGRLRYVSPSVSALLGYSPSELLGTAPWRLLHPADRAQLAALRRTPGEPGGGPLRLRVRHRSGRLVWLETAVSRIQEDGRTQFLSTSRDVSARMLAEGRLKWAATHDPLTGLANRARLYQRLEEQLARARRTGRPDYAVLYLDMDRFKVINDSLGHAAGDELLRAFAQRLSACLAGEALVSRLGGDEFAALLCGLPAGDLSRVSAAATRLQGALAQPFTVEGHAVRVTVSIGIAPGELHHQAPADILRDADLSMYRAKRDPARPVVTFHPEMHAVAVRQLRIEADLPHAARRGQLRLVYQPIVDLRTGETGAFEALLRWQHPHLGNVPPAEFIALAEELEVISALGEYVLYEACRTFQGEMDHAYALQVNVSTRQFLRAGFAATVREVLDATGFPARRLHLEITESALIVNVEEAARTLGELRALGVQIHIDDFGTGYSSLAFLHRFPVDALKIDRAFIARLGEDEVSAKVVQTVLLLARTLNVGVIAEGIETAPQRDHLLALGCRHGQGYLFSRPLERGAAVAWLRCGAPGALEQTGD